MTQDTGPDAPITGVTVFTDGARIQRTTTLEAEPGLRPVKIAELPVSADLESVRVAIFGRDLALLNVEVHHRVRTDPLREEVAQLRSALEECQDAVQLLDDTDAAEQARLAFLGHLSESAATALARAVGSGRANHDDLSQMASHLSADTAAALAQRRDIGARRRAAQRELEAAEHRLAAAEQRGREPAGYAEVLATLDAAAAVRAEVELSYHVSGASWRPLYDLTLDGERLSVASLAEVTQQSGEDWPAVPLALATSRRQAQQGLPELSPWYIGRARPVPAPAVGFAAGARASRGRDSELPVTPMAAAAIPAEGAREAAPPLTAEAGESGAGLVYQVQRPLAVPADGGPHKTTVARFELDAALDHLAVPALATEAYLRATVTNTSPLLLLPGRARVYHDTRFVGETALDTVAAGEEFELQLGVDDQIRVERKLRRRSTSKAVLGGTRTIDIGYEITVENHRPNPARVSVHDHVPVSTDGDIKVRLRETSPAPAGQDDLGELTWNLTLDPGQTATVRYRFTVEHPAQLTVVGL
jgi:uncharacterized protein (TIGR02231 family)